MSSDSLTPLCTLVSNAAMKSASTLCERLLHHADLFTEQAYVTQVFAFMNYTLAFGVWTNLSNKRLRRDLQLELKTLIILRLAAQQSDSSSNNAIAARAVFVSEEFNAYGQKYMNAARILGHSDGGTVRLFALEQIQYEHDLEDWVVEEFFPTVASDTAVESVAMHVNKAAQEMRPKGFLSRLFGQ